MKPSDIDQLNLPRYKADSQAYEKLISNLRRILKFISTDELIKELKRRKILTIKWNEEIKNNQLTEVLEA